MTGQEGESTDHFFSKRVFEDTEFFESLGKLDITND